jgi:hypothetical protein
MAKEGGGQSGPRTTRTDGEREGDENLVALKIVGLYSNFDRPFPIRRDPDARFRNRIQQLTQHSRLSDWT